jgi:predicted CoA-binding protein
VRCQIRNDEARAIAEEAGLRYVEDRCLKVEDARLLGRSHRDG